MGVRKRNGPGGVSAPRSPDHEGMHFMAKSIMDHDRVLRQVLKEAVDRFNHELLDDEERQMLLDRIKRLRRQLGLVV
jgi:glucosamine 6-phosphate synthetase-like amidotransferase/phosphosugar isomerase protein